MNVLCLYRVYSVRVYFDVHLFWVIIVCWDKHSLTCFLVSLSISGMLKFVTVTRFPIVAAVPLILHKFREAALIAFSTSGGGGRMLLPAC